MGTPETKREPCPDRILDDIGGSFGLGSVVGSAFHFVKGIYNYPAGARLSGGSQAVRMNAPRIGGSFAVWGGLFSTFDCAMVYARQKEDPWNSILSGAVTAGVLSLRQGIRASGRSALVGGMFLALIEGCSIAINKVESGAQHEAGLVAMEDIEGMGKSVPEIGSGSEVGSGSWFGYGNKKEETEEYYSGSKTTIMESFDAPPVPSYEFK
ncbi:unnamed protein product [Cochlearia groenlandica]